MVKSTTRKLFGTDGIRGTANREPMTADIALKVAMAAALVLRRGDHRHLAVIGKDTRLSGYLIEPALTSGFIAMGMDVVLVGPLPTPAIAMLTRSLRADLGVMISASHNPFEDNGIKLFGPDGFKFSDEIEVQIEAAFDRAADQRASSKGLGRAKRLDDAGGRYIEFVKNTFPKRLRLDGLKVVVDCANGAAYKVAPTVLWELGAEVVPIGVAPDGVNINRKCGTTAPETMQETVVAHGADLGIALDGDADRLIMADEHGQILDGDQLMALIALNWHRGSRLAKSGLVATVMSNLGFERHLAGNDVAVTRTQVGDRYVVEAMRRIGSNLGGEQSGHIILGDYSTTGDGLIAALEVLAAIVETSAPASQVCKVFEPVPQLLRNVRVSGVNLLDDGPVKAAIVAGERRLGKAGRLLVRKSGTEPLIRIMAEGEDQALVAEIVDSVAAAVTAAGRAEESAAE
ncbi:MAG TPA: phosphoglucosamine mutase [Stellaceae bacterium]|nr:phosphoglucosamine mutase [Stellaceae bacterium]